MGPGVRSQCACITGALLVLLVGGCTLSQATQIRGSPKVPTRTFAGGCAGTVLTDAEPPVWAQAGWSHAKATPWPVPWAFGTPDTSVAFLFSTVLVAGSGPRIDGSYNKVVWVVEDHPTGYTSPTIEAHPLGQSQPIVAGTGNATASVVDLPKPGCWTFRLSWSLNGQQKVSTMNLDVLPAGTMP